MHLLRATAALGALLCAALLPTAPAFAGEPDPPAQADQESRLRDLQARVAELEAALASLHAGAEGGDGADVAELLRRLDLLAAEIEKLRIGAAAEEKPLAPAHGLGPAASRVYGVAKGVSLGGYGEALYENFDARNDEGEESGAADRFDYLRGVLYVGYKFTDKVLFNSEIEFEHGSTEQGGEVSVEFAYLDFLLSQSASLRTGLMLVPAGFVNEMHEPPVFLGARRPEVESRILPTTWRDLGAGIFGEAGRISYRAFLLTGLDSAGFTADEGVREGRQNGAGARAEDFAIAARVDGHPIPGLLVGAFGYAGRSGQGRLAPTSPQIDPNGTPIANATFEPYDGTVVITDLHAEYRGRGFEARALWARGRIGDAKAINDANGLTGAEAVAERFSGWYAEAGYDVLSWSRGTGQSVVPFVRFERLDTQERVPTSLPQVIDLSAAPPDPFRASGSNKVSVWTYGASYRPIPNVAIKLDYQDFRNANETSVDQISLAAGFLF